MKKEISSLLAIGVFALAAVSAEAATRGNVVVQSPSNSPALAQDNSEAMYLRNTPGGAVVLYVEANEGRTLDVLDVTDSAKIKRIAQLSLPAHSAFDFALPTNDGVMVRYRDGSGEAFLSLKKYKQPTLINSADLSASGTAEKFDDAIVVTTVKGALPSAPPDPTYSVYDDTTTDSAPKLMATVNDVFQEIERKSTGTMYLLSTNGVTVVRQPRVEDENYLYQQSLGK
jgi:hypothetical protein